MPKIVDIKQPFRYAAGEVPKTYKCQICGATHVKLWRKYQAFVEDNTLVCASCLSQMHTQGKFMPVFRDTQHGGSWTDKFGQNISDSIGDFVPAVPTEENDTFWGYSSVPKEGCAWWNKLPNGM